MIISLELSRRKPERPSKIWRDRFVFFRRCKFETGKYQLVFCEFMQTRVSISKSGRIWRKGE